MDQVAYNWLIAANPNRWVRSHFSTRAKCDALTNNLCESFNSNILEAREKPIVGLIECVRRKLVNRTQVKLKGMTKYNGTV